MAKPILFLLLSFYLLTVVSTQLPPIYNETCATDKYPPDPSAKPPEFTINLDLPPQERWSEISGLYKKQIIGLIAYIKTYFVQINPKLEELIKIMDSMGNLADALPAPFGDEIKGIATTVGLPVGDILFYNIFYEVTTFCTSIVTQDKQGNMLHARNMDFGSFIGWDIKNDTWIITEMLRPLIYKGTFVRGGKLAYKTISYAGYVGVITGIKPGVLSITLNARVENPLANSGLVGFLEFALGINRNQQFVTFLSRELMEDDKTDFSQAIDRISKTPLIAPVYYIIAGPNSLQGSIITRNRQEAEDVWMLGSNSTWFIAETNYDHWKKPLFIDDRITPTNVCMNKTGQDKISFAGLYNVLSTIPVLNKATVYTALMDVKTGTLEAYIQECKSPCWPL